MGEERGHNRVLNNSVQPQLYGNATHYGHDLEGKTHEAACAEEEMCLFEWKPQYEKLWLPCICMCFRRGAAQLIRVLMQKYSSLRHSRVLNYIPDTKCYGLSCFLYYLSLSSAYEVIEPAPLSFALTLLCFQCPSMHQCQPPSPQAADL